MIRYIFNQRFSVPHLGVLLHCRTFQPISFLSRRTTSTRALLRHKEVVRLRRKIFKRAPGVILTVRLIWIVSLSLFEFTKWDGFLVAIIVVFQKFSEEERWVSFRRG